MKRVWMCLLLLLACLGPDAGAENRFPKPQFESGYTMPAVSVPAPRAAALAALDVAVLAGALALAAWLALKRRSRRDLYLLTLFSLLYFGFWRKGCVCSIGSIQNVAVWLSDPGVVLPLSVVAFFILPLVFALFFGRVFCAAVCPLGAIQEMTLLFPMRVPARVAQVLKVIPVVYLGLAVLLAATGSAYIICRYDPFIAIFRLSGEAPILIAGVGLLLVGLVVARPYCRFLCPYGVLLSGLSRLSKWHVTITPDECVRCRLCETACPFDAIRVPMVGTAEPREQGLRRLKGLLVLCVLLVVAGGWAGSRLDTRLARMNPAVRLEEALRTQDPALSMEIEAFQSSGATREDLERQAALARARFHRGGWWLGGLLGGFLGLGLITLSLRRARVDYEIDRGECLSCARCFESCPKEHERLGKGREAHG